MSTCLHLDVDWLLVAPPVLLQVCIILPSFAVATSLCFKLQLQVTGTGLLLSIAPLSSFKHDQAHLGILRRDTGHVTWLDEEATDPLRDGIHALGLWYAR